MIGASREMVSRVLKEFERQGYIEVQGRRLTLTCKLPTSFS
jgi:CRP-like cAMP-binding protein